MSVVFISCSCCFPPRRQMRRTGHPPPNCNARHRRAPRAAYRLVSKFNGAEEKSWALLPATSPSRAGRTRTARRRPDLFGDFAHSTICRASECRECRLSTVLAAENRRAHNERGGFRFARVPQLRAIRRYFASNTSGMPNQSFIPAQLFAFAETWIAAKLIDIAYGAGFVLVRRPTLGQLPGTR